MTQVRQPSSDSQRELRGILRSGRTALLSVGVFSLVSNMLLLAIPLYTLQVYDRVLNSKSLPTLFGLFLLVTVMLIFNGVIDLVRSRIVTRIALDVDRRIGMTTFNAVNRLSLNHGRSAAHVLRDVDTVRQFIASPAPLAFFDAPWAVIFLLVLFALHWSLGVVATVGGIVLVVLAVMTDRMTRALFAETDKAAIKANEMAEASNRNAEAMFGLGMSRSYADRWQEAKWETLRLQTATNDRISTMTTLSKGVRMLLQMVVVTVGATLAIGGSITIGTIIAASILLGRALAPVEQVVGQWRSFGAFRRSYAKVDELLRLAPSFADKVQLPPMEGRLQAVGARVAPPAARQLVVNGATFEVEPGQLLAIVGPSGSGKSSLARAIVGLWPVVAGELRIDGARPDQWNVEQFGRSIGYLPQGMELFAGTVAANIARFDSDPDMDEVIAAAQAANAHEMILKLPSGYETELSSFADNLSGGQRQRIALARALYGDPALLVLDEPNSNLDQAGEEALRIVLDAAKARRKTVVVVTHRMSIVQHDDLVLALHSGQQIAFGTREDVIRRLTPAPPVPPAPQQIPRPQRAAIGAAPLPLRWDGNPDRNAKPNGGA